MNDANPTWGEQRIANELLLKAGIQVSARTIRKYLQTVSPRNGKSSSMRWSTFIRNHAKDIVACDFFNVVTARFNVLYVLVIMEVGSRRILHCNLTGHPSAEWTIQQFRDTFPWEKQYKFLIHDRGSVFNADLDRAARVMGMRALRTPFRSPTANSHCERLVGTIRRECLDHLIPLNELHVWRILHEFVIHFNRGRPHTALGPGIPEPIQAAVPTGTHRHKLPAGHRSQLPLRLGWLAS